MAQTGVSAIEIPELNVAEDFAEVFQHGDRIGASFRKLADVGQEKRLA